MNPSGLFHLDENDATLSALVSFDREVQERYDLVIAASDSSLSESKTTLVNLTVHIDDLNDNAPAFDHDRTVVHLPDPTEPGKNEFTQVKMTSLHLQAVGRARQPSLKSPNYISCMHV